MRLWKNGSNVAKELSEKGKQFVIIDYSEDKIEEIRKRYAKD